MSDASAKAAQMHAAALIESRIETLEKVTASALLQRDLFLSAVASLEGQIGSLGTYLGLPGPELAGLDLDPVRARLTAMQETFAGLKRLAAAKEA